jgi:DNA-binding transcriptional ArsR family regulator
MKNLEHKFIKGPVWCDWLAKASKVGVSPGLVGNALWFYVGVNNAQKFKIDSRVKEITSLSRQTISTSLKQLEKAGLISIYPARGSYPTIHLHSDRPTARSSNHSTKTN